MLRNASGGGGLPSEYQQVEWIGTSQGVATNTTPHISVMIPFQAGDVFTSHYKPINSKSDAVVVAIRALKYAFFEVYFDKNGTVAKSYNRVRIVEQSYNGTFYIIKSSPTMTEANSWYNIAFYSTNYPADYRYYYFLHERSGEKIAELIPCYRKSDGKIGMYDTVNGAFYANTGTGVFEKGADV